MSRIAIDAMGGDYAPVEIVKGAVAAAREIDDTIAILGPEDRIRECLENEGWQTHVNLIPLNKVEGRSYNAAVNSNIMQFKKTLENAGIAVTVRRTLGADIDAACGQLRNR